jgi:hypothetical protein
VTITALSLGACGKPTTAPADAAAPAAAAPAAAPAAAAPAATFEGKAPAFAANYPGTTNTASIEIGPLGGAFNFETPDSTAKVVEYYAGLAKAAGLTAKETNGAYNTVYSAAGPAGEITVQATTANGKTSVGVTWAKTA